MTKILIDRAVVEQALEALDEVTDWNAAAIGNARRMREASTALRAALAEPAEQELGMVKIPTSIEEAEAMQKIGYAYLHQYAPERLTKPAEQDPVKFLANGTRFKMSFFQNEDGEGNAAPGTHVKCFEAFEEELDGRWVALVPAEDDFHRKYTAPQPAIPPVVKWTLPSGIKVADTGFVWDGETQQHTPKLVIHFEPVPANSGLNAKGWQDRDAFVAMLDAAPEAPQPAKRQPLTNLEGLKLAYNHRWLDNLSLRDAFLQGIRDAEAAHGIGGEA